MHFDAVAKLCPLPPGNFQKLNIEQETPNWGFPETFCCQEIAHLRAQQPVQLVCRLHETVRRPIEKSHNLWDQHRFLLD